MSGNRFAPVSTLVLSALTSDVASALHALEATTPQADPHLALIAAGSAVAGSGASLLLNLLASNVLEAKNEKLARRSHLLRHGMAAALRTALRNRKDSSDPALPVLPAGLYDELFAGWFRLLDEAMTDHVRLEELFPVGFADSHWEALINDEDAAAAIDDAFGGQEEEHAGALANLLRDYLTVEAGGGSISLFSNRLRERWTATEALDFARTAMPFYRAAFDSDFSKGGPISLAFDLKARKQLVGLAKRQMELLLGMRAEVGTIKTGVGRLLEIFEGRRMQAPPEPVIVLGNLDKEVLARDVEADELCDALNRKDTRVVSIAAPPGFGKSSVFLLAVRKTLERKMPDLTGIGEVNARVTKDVVPAFARLLERITGFEALPANEEQPATALDRFFDHLRRCGRVWLVVENAEELLGKAGGDTHPDAAARAGFRDFLKAWLRANHSSRLLLLTRVAWHPSPGPPAHRRLARVEEALRGGLPDDDAVALLRRQFRETRFEGIDEALRREIVRRLHRMPMAIEQFAGYLRANEAGIPRLDWQFVERNDLLRLFDPEQTEDFLLRVIGEHVALLDGRARLFLNVVAWGETPVPLDGLKEVDEEFGLGDGGEVHAAQVLTALVRSGILEEIEGSRAEGIRFQMHALVWEAITDRNETGLDLARIGSCFGKAGLSARNEKAFHTAFLLLGLAEQAFRSAVEREGRGDLSNDLARAIMIRGVALFNLGRLPEALEAHDLAIGILRRLVEQDRRADLVDGLAMAIASRGNALYGLGRPTEAAEAYDDAIEIFRGLGGTAPTGSLARTIMNRGNALYSREQVPEALRAYDDAIEIFRRLTEHDDGAEWANDLATAVMNRGSALNKLRQWKEAAEAYWSAMTMFRDLVRKDGRTELTDNLARAIMNWGVALDNLRQWPEAVQAYDGAIEIFRRLVGSEGRAELANELATATTNRGNALSSLGRHVDALEAHDEAITILRGLVEQEGRTELAGDLAKAIENRSHAIRRRERQPQ